MVAYSFQRQFAEPILRPVNPKRHTIRGDRKRHARPGEELQLYIGMRTSSCLLLARTPCSSVLPIQMDLRSAQEGGSVVMCHGWHISDRADLDEFAASDGFEDWRGLLAFWAKHHPGIVVFNGWMISWAALTPTTT